MRTLFFACSIVLFAFPSAALANLPAYTPVPSDKQLINFADQVLSTPAVRLWRIGYEQDGQGAVLARMLLTTTSYGVVILSFVSRDGEPDIVNLTGIAYGARNFAIHFVDGKCRSGGGANAIPCTSASSAEWRRLYTKTSVLKIFFKN